MATLRLKKSHSDSSGSHYILQKFRENNDFTFEVTKELILRNTFSVRVTLRQI